MDNNMQKDLVTVVSGIKPCVVKVSKHEYMEAFPWCLVGRAFKVSFSRRSGCAEIPRSLAEILMSKHEFLRLETEPDDPGRVAVKNAQPEQIYLPTDFPKDYNEMPISAKREYMTARLMELLDLPPNKYQFVKIGIKVMRMKDAITMLEKNTGGKGDKK